MDGISFTVHPRTADEIPSAPCPAFLVARGVRMRSKRRQLPLCAPGDRIYTFPQLLERGVRVPVRSLMGGEPLPA